LLFPQVTFEGSLSLLIDPAFEATK